MEHYGWLAKRLIALMLIASEHAVDRSSSVSIMTRTSGIESGFADALLALAS